MDLKLCAVFSGLSVWAAQLPKPKLQLRASASAQKRKRLTARKVEEKQVPINPTVVETMQTVGVACFRGLRTQAMDCYSDFNYNKQVQIGC